MKHALLSPSSAYRWMTCSGSVAMCAGRPDEESEYAAEGTAAHLLASMCFAENRDAAAFMGRRIAVGHRTFEVDDEMADAVQLFVDYVRGLQALPGAQLLFDQRLPISHVTGEEGAEGTGDALILLPDELIVPDFKYGRGVPVAAKNNKQLQLYALGGLEIVSLLGYQPKNFRLVIHQPRVNPAPDEWTCTLADLEEFKKVATSRADLAMAAYRHREEWMGTVHALARLQPSEEGCQFCHAKPTCPALAQFVQKSVGAEFENIAAIDTPTSFMPDDQLGVKMDAVELVEDWCRAVRAEIERRLLAAIPVSSPKGGYKLVQGRQGNRAWADEAAAEEMLRKRFRLPMEEAYSMKVISPTKAETVLKDKPKQWAAISVLITRAEGKKSVAPMSDARPAINVKPPSEDFEVVSDLV